MPCRGRGRAGGPAGRPMVKVCGVKRRLDLEYLDGLVEYVGFIVAPEGVSPRALSPSEAWDLASTLSRSEPVMVAAGMGVGDAVSAAASTGFRVVQLHMPLEAGEAAAAVEAAAGLGLRAAPVLVSSRRGWLGASPGELAGLLEPGLVEYVLVDADKRDPPGGPGGLRVSLDAVSEAVAVLSPRGFRVGAAGGVRPGNSCLVARLGVSLVDVSSGVEEAPGVKSPLLVSSLLRELEGCTRGARQG